MEKIKRIEEIFANLYNADTDWSLAADMFVAWNISNNFEIKSFKEFVDWIDDDDINNTWHFFFGYGDDFKKFADDWIEEGEREDYLKYCEKSSRHVNYSIQGMQKMKGGCCFETI